MNRIAHILAYVLCVLLEDSTRGQLRPYRTSGFNNKHGDTHHLVKSAVNSTRVHKSSKSDSGGIVARLQNFPPLLSLLTCLLTPDRVPSPYCPYTAPTVHVRTASCGSVAFISEDVPQPTAPNGRRVSEAAIVCVRS